jgi:tripartite-type tricarboxylate transporter receptor subunit TctC
VDSGHAISSKRQKPVRAARSRSARRIIGAQAVASAEGDGYTLLMWTFAHAGNPSLNARLPFDPNRDFAPVALIARSPNIVVVNPKSSLRSIADLIAAAKAELDKIS